MEPLRITATIVNSVSFHHPIHLCSLLQARVAARSRHLPPICKEECADIDIPVQRSECGRFFMASVGYSRVVQHRLEHIHRYYPTHYAVRRSSVRSVNLSAGVSKSFRIPIEKKLLAGGRITWWCIGDRDKIEEILRTALYLGRGRSRGAGKVDYWGDRWQVEPCDPWPGFPVLSSDGDAMRNLPLDYPGLKSFEIVYSRLTGPFWASWDREQIAAPVVDQ